MIDKNVFAALEKIERLALTWNRSNGVFELDEALRGHWQEMRDEIYRLGEENEKLRGFCREHVEKALGTHSDTPTEMRDATPQEIRTFIDDVKSHRV